MSEHYDVAVYGLWYGNNYGSIITYYALSKVLESMNLSYAMIRNPLGREIDIDSLAKSHPLRFAKERYNITPLYKISDLGKLNEMFDTFLIGSDQMWNYHLSRPYQQSYYFDFVNAEKNKIAYGTSFGRDPYNGPDEEKPVVRKNLHRFNAISVRDDFSQRICHDDFGINAELVYDPVFLCDIEKYHDLIKETDLTEAKNPFYFAYVLDPSIEFGSALKRICNESGKRALIIFDQSRYNGEHDINSLLGTLGVTENDPITALDDPTVKEWLYCFKNSEFVITDSFHGACFSVIFNKDFIVLQNVRRGGERFPFLLGGLGLTERMAQSHAEIAELYTKYSEENKFKIDYSSVNGILDEKKAESFSWLRNAVDTSKVKSPPVTLNNPMQDEIERLHKNPDFIKIRLLATLFRDYGVKHIVLSPGGRDVPLVRMFEYNESSFILHRVTDERSAAYFGMGIATQLRKPVACICTSGTAASNYLPAVTEAYYTGIPLIVVTADRQSVYHEHGEDQTIPQQHIYDGVVKKSITVPEGSGYKAEYQTRRDISDCILETTHNGFGPTHINIAIDNIAIGSKAPREAWKLLPKINPHILRVSFNDGEKRLMDWVAELKKSQRILVVYGQNPPPSELQKKYIEDFAKKYNCVIITDHISNLDCAYSLKPFNMLQAISNAEFNEKLSPSILITVGGKRLMNDPLTSKVRGGAKNIRHWSVAPDGRIKDFYFRLTSVIEMSQDKFFEWFSSHAGDITNNGQYYEQWRQMASEHGSPEITGFTSNYIQSKFFPQIPANSVLHLGVGQSFYDCRKYVIDKTVEVYCNMGTNGIDGCTSTFMGQCAVVKDKLCFLIVGDLSFFYDMNSIWNKELSKNIRILMVNNNGTGLLRGHKLKGITSAHNTSAKGWVEATGFKYISATSKEDYEGKLKYFLSTESDAPLFFEVFCQ